MYIVNYCSVITKDHHGEYLDNSRTLSPLGGHYVT